MEEPDRQDGGSHEREEATSRQARFAGLVALHHARLMSFVLSLLPNWADAEDVLQQTNEVMWQKFAEFEAGTDFLSWGCRIARYHVLNHLRKRTRERRLFSDELVESLADEALAEADRLEAERQALRGCLAKLDESSRGILSRCYEPGISVMQVAEQLGRTANSIYKKLDRIRSLLYRCIRQTLARRGEL